MVLTCVVLRFSRIELRLRWSQLVLTLLSCVGLARVGGTRGMRTHVCAGGACRRRLVQHRRSDHHQHCRRHRCRRHHRRHSCTLVRWHGRMDERTRRWVRRRRVQWISLRCGRMPRPSSPPTSLLTSFETCQQSMRRTCARMHARMHTRTCMIVHRWFIKVTTGRKATTATDANVTFELFGREGKTGPLELKPKVTATRACMQARRHAHTLTSIPSWHGAHSFAHGTAHTHSFAHGTAQHGTARAHSFHSRH